MASKTHLNEWYGYDKKVERPVTKYPKRQFYHIQDSYRSYSYRDDDVFITSEARDSILAPEFEMPKRKIAVDHYYPPSDGLTDDDFINWLRTFKSVENSYYKNWRVEKISEFYSGPILQNFKYILHEFFSYDKRTDRAFRLIELNEFVHRGKENQTFEEFLDTDAEYIVKCKNLHFHSYSKLSENISKSSYYTELPSFLSFKSNVSLKTKKLLLPLTLQEMKKVLDYENNTFNETVGPLTSAAVSMQLFIDGALNKATKAEVRTRTELEISNEIVIGFMKISSQNFENLAQRVNLTWVLQEFSEEIGKMSLKDECFTRNLAHLISSGGLKNLTPSEYIAVIYGYEKSHRWTERTNGITVLEMITELIHEDKMPASSIAKLISYIIINDLQPIAFEKDFDWEENKDTPPDWLYNLLTPSSKKKSLKQPALVKSLS
jgi:hypothetical protein